MPVSERTYRQVALEDPEGQWELDRGRLRRKPAMTLEHNQVASELFFALRQQLDRGAYDVRLNMGHVQLPGGSYYIPDVFVVPVELQHPLRGRRVLETYDEPLPLVVEVWSPSTGDYDIDTKVREYQRRGDREIWRVHPYDRTITAWRRQTDGSYASSLHTGGMLRPAALPGVHIDLDALFVE
jgi:Uma2 family endonuclease